MTKNVFISGLFLAGMTAFFIGQKLAVDNADRLPASTTSHRFDYSNLSGDAFQMAATDRIIRGAKIIQSTPLYGVSLGGFQMRNENKVPVDVCSVYNKLSFTYMAGDMAVSGEPPEMKLFGPCLINDTGVEIAPHHIHQGQVTSLQPRDREIDLKKDFGIIAKFSNISDAWPKVWVLKQVHLSRPSELTMEAPTEIVIELREIKQIYGKNVVLEWN